jgi:hypothetical protein
MVKQVQGVAVLKDSLECKCFGKDFIVVMTFEDDQFGSSDFYMAEKVAKELHYRLGQYLEK